MNARVELLDEEAGIQKIKERVATTSAPPLREGARVRFAHEPVDAPGHRVRAVVGEMVELEDMRGYFAPHLFVRIE